MKKTFIHSFVILLLGITLCSCQNNGSIVPPPDHPQTKNIYATEVMYTAENDGAAAYMEIATQSNTLFHLLEQHRDGFVMDAYNYQEIDENGTLLYTQNDLSLPVELDPAGHHIRESPNYFKFNPVETVSEDPIENQIIWEDNTLNILVPEKHKLSENEIIAEYLELFYFEKIEVDNIYPEDMGQPLLKDSMQDLKINIIYVKDGQEYFTFRTDLARTTNNSITDPIVSIYTGNIHSSYIHSFMSQFVYFYTNAATPETAYESISPYIQQANAENSFQKVTSVEKSFSSL